MIDFDGATNMTREELDIFKNDLENDVFQLEKLIAERAIIDLITGPGPRTSVSEPPSPGRDC